MDGRSFCYLIVAGARKRIVRDNKRPPDGMKIARAAFVFRARSAASSVQSLALLIVGVTRGAIDDQPTHNQQWLKTPAYVVVELVCSPAAVTILEQRRWRCREVGARCPVVRSIAMVIALETPCDRQQRRETRRDAGHR